MVQVRAWNACFATKLDLGFFGTILLWLSALRVPTVGPSGETAIVLATRLQSADRQFKLKHSITGLESDWAMHWFYQASSPYVIYGSTRILCISNKDIFRHLGNWEPCKLQFVMVVGVWWAPRNGAQEGGIPLLLLLLLLLLFVCAFVQHREYNGYFDKFVLLVFNNCPFVLFLFCGKGHLFYLLCSEDV